MPWAPQPECRFPGCRTRVPSAGYCAEHRKQRWQYDNSHKEMYGWRWRKFSRQRLREHPLCEECQRNGKVSPGRVTDHKTAHKGNPLLFWNNTFQSLCLECHARKSAQEVVYRGGS